jgi:hypothetical protein
LIPIIYIKDPEDQRQRVRTEERTINPDNFERRRYPRFPIDFPVEYWRIDISKSRPGRTGDISEGGVLLYLPEKIAVGQNIGVKILIGPELESKFIEALGQVTWNDSHFGKKDFYHRIGLKFLDISAENMEELINSLIAQMNLGDPSELNIPPTLSSPFEILGMNRREKPPTVAEPSQEGKWEVLQQGEEGSCSESDDVNEEDANKFPQELIHDLQENYTDEQRQNLYERILDMGVPEKQRLAALANREARNLLIRDPNKMISLNVLKNAKINESEILHYARRRDLSPDILSAIAQDQKWKKNYPIKFALASNPKTPFSVSINFLSHFYERDLKLLSREKNVSFVLRRRAQEILHERNEK